MINGKEVGMIVASDIDGVIGYGGKIPWFNKTDMKRFRTKTMSSTIIMGRKTWESIGFPLPKRSNFIVSRSMKKPDGAEVFRTIKDAISSATTDSIWLIGGTDVYQQALDARLIDVVDHTIINIETKAGSEDQEILRLAKITMMPTIPLHYRLIEEEVNAEDPSMSHRTYVIRKEYVRTQ